MADNKKQIPDNLKYYEALRYVPQEALKPIKAGRLQGMSDINPVWRFKAMTEVFGPCGIGWKYEITKQWQEQYGQEVKSFTNINLYVKVDGQWSEPIPGTGGATVVEVNSKGLYVNDECLDGDCELLTKSGWIKLKDLEKIQDVEVAQYYPYSEMIDFCKPLRFVHKKSSDVYDKEGFFMTANHRHLVFSRGTNDLQVKHAEELAKLSFKKSDNGYGRSGNFRDIKCGHFFQKRQLSTLDRIGIMIACDGTLYRENGDGKTYWRCEFLKKRKVQKAEMLLKELGVSYKKDINERKFGTTTSFIFELGNNVNYKEYSNFLPYGDYDGLWEEVVSWDGCTHNHESFSTVNKNSAEYLQTLLCLSGQVVSIYKQDRSERKASDLYTLYRKKHNTAMSGFKKVEGTYDMYCVDVPTTFILVRKNGEIIVTGNCHKMSLTDALSVAMKSLGVAADVYFAKGKELTYDTKYSQQVYSDKEKPVSQTMSQATNNAAGTIEYDEELQVAFEMIKANIESAPSKQYLMDLHKQNAMLHKYEPYRKLMNKRFGEVK